MNDIRIKARFQNLYSRKLRELTYQPDLSEGTAMQKKKARKIISAILVAILLILVASYIIAINFLVDFSMKKDFDFSLFGSENNSEEPAENDEHKPDTFGADLDEFFANHSFEKKEYVGYDGTKRVANVLQNGDGEKWAIIVHGYNSDKSSMNYFAEKYYENGFSVFLPDLAAHGESEGEYRQMGWNDRLDVVSYAKDLAKNYPDCEIILTGISMGGATVMMASGEEDLPDNVKCVVEDCGYSSVFEEFSYELKELFNLPAFPLMQGANLVAKARCGFDLKEASAVEALKSAKVPVLFIHGGSDTFVPTEMVYKVYEACATKKELLIINSATHGASCFANPELYWQTTFGFIAKYVK